MKIEGTTAVITGGATGIGLAIGQQLLARGARVMLADIEGDKARKAAKDLGDGALGHGCDVRDLNQVADLADAALQAFGSVELVFANAGVMSNAQLINYDPAQVDWIFDVNVKGVWNTASVFGRLFIDAGNESAICITGSEHSLGVPHLGGGIYTATKHAVHGMADVMRREMPDFVQVSLLCPGITGTELFNAGRNGPQGGLPEERAAQQSAFMQQGMTADYVAQCAIEGVEKGDFYILSHPHVHKFAADRWAELDKAFADGPKVDQPERFDVEAMIAKLSGR